MTGMIVVKWWLTAALLGVGFYPLTARLFRIYEDRGWLFSKVLGLAVGGYLVWVLSCIGVVPFTRTVCVVLTAAAAVLCWVIRFVLQRRASQRRASQHLVTERGTRQRRALLRESPDVPPWKLILTEELILFGLLVFWTYVIGFRPAADTTEKFMDYGFMAVMDRSTKMPAPDMWFGTDPINYYYGGQYFAVYFAKLAFTGVKEAYNLMRALISAFAFVLPLSMVRELLLSRKRVGTAAAASPKPANTASSKSRETLRAGFRADAWIGGLLAGAAVSVAGNVHYLLYGLFGKQFKLSGYEDYWFPESTRYIGHNPPTDDACIHEFPSYSIVLGDLHAHMINILFVMLFLGILTAWMLSVRYREKADARFGRSIPYLIFLGTLTGMFKWTNYWDYVIYLTVLIIAILVMAIRGADREKERLLLSVAVPVLQIIIVVLIGKLSALPFTATFKMMVSEVRLCENHTAFYQLAVLWGLPILTLALYCIHLITKRKPRTGFLRNLFKETDLPSLIILMLGFCAVGLILLPEIVYVKDIYENGYSRSNTMFKLTYQAFILFGILFGYALTEMLFSAKRIAVRAVSAIFLGVLILTCGYMPYSIGCWFGNILDPAGFQGLDATAFVEESYPEDAGAIRWLDEEIKGTPIVLEAYGDSYTKYCRVSAMTGLPTIEGWYVHEWLWREDVDEQIRRIRDIDAIYQSDDAEEIQNLAKQYNIRYIFIGSCEREMYDDLNEDALRSAGTVVYDDPEGAVIVEL